MPIQRWRRGFTGGWDETARMWELATGKQVRVFKGHNGAFRSVALSHDGKYLASGSNDKTARLWNVADGKKIRVFKYKAKKNYRRRIGARAHQTLLKINSITA